MAHSSRPHRDEWGNSNLNPQNRTAIPRKPAITAPNLTRQARLLPPIEWLLLTIFAFTLLFQTLPDAWRSLNTDFVNYDIVAKLVRDHSDMTHLYEWRWLARQKDHHQIDRAIIGLVPITPFSTLAIVPLASLDPLTAKRIWLLLQLALLFPTALGLRALAGQPLRRIALIIAACLPLHRNLLYGQFYILLLALVVFACWALQRERPTLAGALVALAAAIKLFPVIFILYFLRKRQWRAAAAALITGATCAATSIAIFGWEVHRTYLLQVLPWTLRGDALPPYAVGSGSISTLLHRLFLYEPQWNPHPWLPSPTLFAVLQAILPTLILAPTILLCDEHDRSPQRIALEWSALTIATLTISTIPASYNFTLMILPMTVLCATLLPRRPALIPLIAALYFSIGYPKGWHVGSSASWRVALQFPRLYLLIALLALVYLALGATAFRNRARRPLTLAIAAALALMAASNILSNLRYQRHITDDFAYRLSDASGALLSAAPQSRNGQILRIAMQPGGYRLLSSMTTPPTNAPWPENAVGPDDIAFASSPTRLLIESAGPHSRILSPTEPFTPIDDAESPTLSPDGKTLAYLRLTNNRARLFTTTSNDPLTPSNLNVEQATFLPDNSLIIAAYTPATTGPRLFRILPHQPPQLLPLGEARYPAASPDGHYLAYSRLSNGNWNLTLLDLHTGAIRPIADAPCNTTEPAWEPDSRTILYASDCGRALWFSAISRRRIIP